MDSNFPRINQLPPYVFDEIQSLKASARKGEDIIDFVWEIPTNQLQMRLWRSCEKLHWMAVL